MKRAGQTEDLRVSLNGDRAGSRIKAKPSRHLQAEGPKPQYSDIISMQPQNTTPPAEAEEPSSPYSHDADYADTSLQTLSQALIMHEDELQMSLEHFPITKDQPQQWTTQQSGG